MGKIMASKFQENLKALSKQYTQRHIAEKTGFSQSSINNYISGTSEPSIQFLIALKDGFGIDIDNFLFGDFEKHDTTTYDRFIGNYIVYYYNNTSYKGEVHTNIKNTMKYGVISVLKEKELDSSVVVYGAFVTDRVEATRLLKRVNSMTQASKIIDTLAQSKYFYKGNLFTSTHSISIELKDKENGDFTYILLTSKVSSLTILPPIVPNKLPSSSTAIKKLPPSLMYLYKSSFRISSSPIVISNSSLYMLLIKFLISYLYSFLYSIIL